MKLIWGLAVVGELTMSQRENLEQKALDKLNEYGIDATNGVDILAFTEQAGFAVYNFELDPDDDGFVLTNNGVKEIMGIPTKKLIGVNAQRNGADKRFIIAHELAHYFIEGESESVFANRSNRHGRSDEENDVDYLAACLLMPRDAFQQAHQRLSGTETSLYGLVEGLVNIFKTPFESVVRRLDELNLVNTCEG